LARMGGGWVGGGESEVRFDRGPPTSRWPCAHSHAGASTWLRIRGMRYPDAGRIRDGLHNARVAAV
jgi:hypothetical protein